MALIFILLFFATVIIGIIWKQFIWKKFGGFILEHKNVIFLVSVGIIVFYLFISSSVQRKLDCKDDCLDAGSPREAIDCYRDCMED